MRKEHRQGFEHRHFLAGQQPIIAKVSGPRMLTRRPRVADCKALVSIHVRAQQTLNRYCQRLIDGLVELSIMMLNQLFKVTTKTPRHVSLSQGRETCDRARQLL